MSTLEFGTMLLSCGEKPLEAPLPDLLGIPGRWRDLQFELGEEDEVYQGYGMERTAYPYRTSVQYSRELKQTPVRTAVLENSFLRAVFLPDYGGRLWQLLDLKTGRNLIYTNDVLRASNLAFRGPGVAGGAQWNLGTGGYGPLTLDTVFTARLEGASGPVLRMYGYERIRRLSWQMDFWLDCEKPGLNCHMAVFNQNDQVLPVSWWSNVAVPMYPDGRIFVPAHRAFAEDGRTVRPVSVPEDGQIDISWYESITRQRDYSFQLDRGAPRWMAHVDPEGYGLLYSSSDRLRSRRLSAWGTTEGSRHWQEFLTRNAGPYITLQAGLSPTPFGGIPMSPGTVWQWTERLEPIYLPGGTENLRFEETNNTISTEYFPALALRIADQQGRKQLRLPARTVIRGDGSAMVDSAVRTAQGLEPLTPHLDLMSPDPRTAPWIRYLETGEFPDFPPEQAPAWDLSGEFFCKKLLWETERRRGGWYAPYGLALLELQKGREDLAQKFIDRSLAIRETAWAWYVKAVLLLKQGDHPIVCRQAILKSLEMGENDLSHVKFCLQVLGLSGDWEIIRDLELPEPIRRDPGIRMWRAKALSVLQYNREALDLLEADGGLEPADIRPGDRGPGQLWQMLKRRTTGKVQPIPYALNFDTREEE